MRKHQQQQETTKTAVIYARYSSHKQNDESIEQQVEACQEYAKYHNLNIIDTYADRAVSGTSDKRLAFQKMLRDSAKGSFSVVIAYKSNRIGRNMLQALVNEDKLSKNGVSVEYAKETFGNDPAGRFALRSMMNLNQFYSENLGEDVLRGMESSAREGKALCRPPFGYSIVDGKFAINEDQAIAVREIYRLYIEGESFSDISKRITEMGYRSSTGSDFRLHLARSILKNSIYIGIYQWNGIEYNDIPKIIDEKTFEAAKMERQRRIYHPQKHIAGEIYYLTGKLYCGDSFLRMRGTSGHYNNKIYRYYICNNKESKVRKEDIENAVIKRARAILSKGKLYDDIVKEVVLLSNANKNNDETLKLMEERLEEVNDGLNNIVSAIEKGVAFDNLLERKNELEKEKKELSDKISEVIKSLTIYDKRGVEKALNSYAEYNVKYKGLNFRTNVFDKFLHLVIFRHDKITVVYNIANNETGISTNEYVESVMKIIEETDTNNVININGDFYIYQTITLEKEKKKSR